MSAVGDASPWGVKRVVLHIGAPKTGTTYLQQRLYANADALAADGVLYPYTDIGQSFRSAHDFCGSSWFGHHADRFQGEWGLVAQRARDWHGRAVIVSSELMAAARPDRIRKGLALLGPAELHVVFSARDLARQLVSDWQEQVKHRHTVTLERFVDDLVTLGIDAPKPFGELFWGLHDAVRVLATWSEVVPVDRVHVVTVPQATGPHDALWNRFCAVAGLDPARYGLAGKRSNRSMGVVETELVRRMNLGVKKMDAKSYDSLVRIFLAEKVLGRDSAMLTLPPSQRAWALARSRQLVDALAAAGYPVEGDLADLLPVDPGVDYVSPTSLTDADLGPAALKAATALLNRAGKLRDQTVKLEGRLDDTTGEHSRLLPTRRGIAGAGRRAARRLLNKP